MDKIANPYLVLLERLHLLDRSIHILNLVNNDLREILHKQKPLPQFIQDSFKRSTITKTKAVLALPLPPPPAESEEMRQAASIIDKAKRTIENVGEKKPKQSSTVIAPILPSAQSVTTHNNRPKSSSSTRPSSAVSTVPSSSDSSLSHQQPTQSVRRYVPAHMNAPFLTQPEKKRRPSSTIRTSTQMHANQRPSTARRSLSQQRRQSSSSTSQSIVDVPQQAQQTHEMPSIPLIQNENNSMTDDTATPDHTSVLPTTEELIYALNETPEIETLVVPQSIILNRALIKPLRRLWKQNETLRVRLKREFNKESTSSPPFINRLNEQIHSPTITDDIRIPNIEVLLQLAVKLRAIILHLLEHSTFDDLDSALKRLNTLKYLVNRYHPFFTSSLNIFVAKHHSRASNIKINIEEWLNKPKSAALHRHTVRYTDDSQLIAFTEVRFKQFENECRWIELNWHEQMIIQFNKTLPNKDQNPLQIYRELMSLVTGLQTASPIVVENRLE